MTKTTNILQCTLYPWLQSEFADQLELEFPDQLGTISFYMLCSDKIAATARNLELTDFASLINDDRLDPSAYDKYFSESGSLTKKIVKEFRRVVNYEVDFHVNPVGLPRETQSRLQLIRGRFVDELSPEFILIC